MSRFVTTLSLCLLASLLAGCKTLLFGGVGVLEGRHARVTSDIVYDAEHDLRLDVYRSEHATGNAPVVVFLYGGAWISGERRWYRYAGEALAREGFVAMVPDYRKSPAVKFPAFVEDAARAVAWTQAHAAEFGGDARRPFVMGYSAGAHIGALLATDARYLAQVGLAPRDLAGFVGLAGPYDFAPFHDDYLIEIFGAGTDAQHAAMPTTYVAGHEPPMLLLQGAADTTVDPGNSERLARRLRAQGEPVETKFYAGVGHLRIALALARPLAKDCDVLGDSARFIRAQAAQAP